MHLIRVSYALQHPRLSWGWLTFVPPVFTSWTAQIPSQVCFLRWISLGLLCQYLFFIASEKGSTLSYIGGACRVSGWGYCQDACWQVTCFLWHLSHWSMHDWSSSAVTPHWAPDILISSSLSCDSLFPELMFWVGPCPPLLLLSDFTLFLGWMGSSSLNHGVNILCAIFFLNGLHFFFKLYYISWIF